jgi:hypothetical protein
MSSENSEKQETDNSLYLQVYGMSNTALKFVY